jgi:excinuclease UvrABC nuclease subunit
MDEKKFSASKPITNKNLKKVPGNKPGVYRILNRKKDILYIGIAKRARLPDRIREHKGKIPGGTMFQFKITRSKEAAERLEKIEIRKHKPPFNK